VFSGQKKGEKLDHRKVLPSVTLTQNKYFMQIVRVLFHLFVMSRNHNLILIVFNASVNSEESVTVLPGISSFPFSFQLPLHIPSSFNSDIGQVVYSMTARLKKSWYKFDLVSSIQFTVTGILDLNREPVVSQPIEIENQKFFCTWPPCKDSVIEVRALFPRKGFVPGEIASFTVEINNESTRSVNKIKAELIQTVSYYAKSSKREGNSVLEKEKEEINVQPGESETWKQNALKIPPCPPSRLAYGCHIIDVHYSIKVRHFCNFVVY